MVKRQHKTSSSSTTSAQIRKPAVTTRSRSSQKIDLVNSIEQQNKIALDMKRKRKSTAEVFTLGETDEINRQSSSSNNTQNSEDKESVLSPPKRAKLSIRFGHNDGQTNVESKELNRESIKIREMVDDNAQNNNNVHDKPLRKSDDKSSIINNKKENDDKIIKNDNNNNDQEIVPSDGEIIQDINTIIDSFMDVVEIRGTQMVIGNFVIEYDQYQEFMTLLNKLLNILETYDSEKVLQSAKKIGSKINHSGQVLNLTLFRAKISKRAYKCLNDLQDDFICTCNDVITTNPKMHNAGTHLLKFGSRLFEQAYKELPSSIRQLENHDKNSGAVKSTCTKNRQKIALVQPTLDGHVFSSGAVKQLPQQKGKKDAFKLVGDLQDMEVVSLQSMDKQEIPKISSILPKRRENHKLLQPEERNVPGIKFHRYKAYASFAPIYDSSDAMLSYEDTMLARTYKKHSRVSKRIENSDLSEEKEKSSSNVETISEGIPAEQNYSGNGNHVENSDKKDKFFEEIDVDLLYKSIKRAQPNEIDEMLDEHVEIFRKVLSMQEKRWIKSSHISAKERKYVYKLQKQLANLISNVSPSDIVSFSAIEDAMDNLLIKERSFKGVLPPNKSFAHPTNEVSRDVFGNLSKSSVNMNSYARNEARMNSKEAVTNSASHHQSMPSQSLHHPTPHHLPSMAYAQSSRAAASQVPMRMQYGASQGTSTQMHASYQMTYSRPLPTQSQVQPYYSSQRYPSYGYPYYPQYGYSMGHSTWQQRPSYY